MIRRNGFLQGCGSETGLNIRIRIQSDHSDRDRTPGSGSNTRIKFQSRHPVPVWKPGSGMDTVWTPWFKSSLNSRIRIQSTHQDSISYNICSHRNFAWYLLHKVKRRKKYLKYFHPSSVMRKKRHSDTEPIFSVGSGSGQIQIRIRNSGRAEIVKLLGRRPIQIN